MTRRGYRAAALLPSSAPPLSQCSSFHLPKAGFSFIIGKSREAGAFIRHSSFDELRMTEMVSALSLSKGRTIEPSKTYSHAPFYPARREAVHVKRFTKGISQTGGKDGNYTPKDSVSFCE
jgi:hypothetical protein